MFVVGGICTYREGTFGEVQMQTTMADWLMAGALTILLVARIIVPLVQQYEERLRLVELSRRRLARRLAAEEQAKSAKAARGPYGAP